LIGIAKNVSAVTGYLINTYKTLVLNQPEYRKHTLSWKLSPKTHGESRKIQQALFRLRKKMTPKRFHGNQLVMEFPSIFLLFFNPNHKFLYEFKPCVLERLTINYNGGNPVPSFFRPAGTNLQDAAPESLMVETSWIEMEYWLDGKAGLSDYKEEDGMWDSDPLNSAYRYNIK
jgi:hypothetical protein